MSRAAPTLNLFAVGLPAGLLIGFLILLVNIEHLAALMATLLESSLGAIARMLAA
jgi:flagellar biosynthetic protein FliR